MQLFRAAILVSALSMPIVSLHGQEPKPTASSRPATVGLLAGISSTTMAGKDAADDLERRVRPFAGMWVVIDLSTRIQLEIDALYAGKGFRSPGVTTDFDLNLGYLEIPALVRMNLAPTARVQPFIGAGAAFGYRITCSTNANTPSFVGLGCDDAGGGTPFNVTTSEVSAVLGAGVDINAGPARLTIGTRFTRGFTAVFENAKNRNEALTLYFGIGKSRQY